MNENKKRDEKKSENRLLESRDVDKILDTIRFIAILFLPAILKAFGFPIDAMGDILGVYIAAGILWLFWR